MCIPHGRPGGSKLSRRVSLAASVVLLVATVVLLASGCDSGPGLATARATTTPLAGLPQFSDWRVIYVDYSGRIHAISLDGKQDVTGGVMLTGSGHAVIAGPSVSPDGHWMAVGCGAGVCIDDLTGHHASLSYQLEYPTFSWTPDSSQLALGTEIPQSIIQVSVSDGTVRTIPPINNAYFGPIGWVDNTHLAGVYAPIPPTPTPEPTSTPRSDYSPPPARQTMTLDVEDVTTGALRTVFSLTSSTLGSGSFILAPDGKHALFYNTPFRDYPYLPDARLIDMSSGVATSLPRLAEALGQDGGATRVAWRAGTMTLAASTLGHGDTWLLDAQHDTAQPLPYHAFVGGWAPDSDTLVLASSPEPSIRYAGPFTYMAIANISSGTGTPITLTNRAYDLWFGGFARTAP